MKRIALFLAVLVPVAFGAGRWSSADDKPGPAAPATVRAKLYRIVWADSALELAHDGGTWVHELFFPELKVAATVVHETEWRADAPGGSVTRPRLYVWRTDHARTDLVGLSVDKAAVQPPIRDVEVPADLARALAAFADLADRYRADGTRLGDLVASQLELRPIADAAGGAPAPPVEAPPAGGK